VDQNLPASDQISDEERARIQRERFLASPDYAHWSRLLRRQEARFRSGIKDSKHLFDFIQMVLATALVFGLAQFLTQATDESANVLRQVSIVGLWLLAGLLGVNVAIVLYRFSTIMGTNIAISMMLPFKRRKGWQGAFTYLTMLVVQSVFAVAIITVAIEVANQAATSGARTMLEQAPKVDVH
jgi:hypothetical protein